MNNNEHSAKGIKAVNGVFNHRNRIVWILSIIAGLADAVLFAVILISGEDKEETTGLIIAAVCGVLLAAFGVLSVIAERKWFLAFDGKTLSAKYGFFRSVDLRVEDIRQATIFYSSLTIVASDNKSYIINSLQNAADIAEKIRSAISGRIDCDTEPEVLYGKLKEALEEKKKNVGNLAICFFVFLALLLAVYVLEEKSGLIPPFLKKEYTVITLVVFALIDMAASLMVANKYGKNTRDISLKREEVVKYLIYRSPLPAGNVYKVLKDDNNSSRLTVMRLPNSDNVYCVIEFIGGKIPMIVEKEESGIFKDYDELLPQIEEMTEITESFQINE